jgi:hypothetical protein
LVDDEIPLVNDEIPLAENGLEMYLFKAQDFPECFAELRMFFLYYFKIISFIVIFFL